MGWMRMSMRGRHKHINFSGKRSDKNIFVFLTWLSFCSFIVVLVARSMPVVDLGSSSKKSSTDVWVDGSKYSLKDDEEVVTIPRVQNKTAEGMFDSLDSESKKEGGSDGAQKLAFIFVSEEKQFPHEALWEKYFGADGAQGKFSIFLNGQPGLSLTPGSQLGRSVVSTELDDIHRDANLIVESQRILLREALKDPLNTRFIYMSESDIPIRSFTCLYDVVMETKKSFIEIKHSNREYRDDMAKGSKLGKSKIYTGKVAPEKWRMGSPFWVLNREHAELVVAEKFVWQTFLNYCHKYGKVPCQGHYPYFPTLLALANKEHEIRFRSLTFYNMKPDGSEVEYGPLNVKSNVRELRRCHLANGHVYADESTDSDICGEMSGTEIWTGISGLEQEDLARPCHMFARKFLSSAAPKLLQGAPAFLNV